MGGRFLHELRERYKSVNGLVASSILRMLDVHGIALHRFKPTQAVPDMLDLTVQIEAVRRHVRGHHDAGSGFCGTRTPRRDRRGLARDRARRGRDRYGCRNAALRVRWPDGLP